MNLLTIDDVILALQNITSTCKNNKDRAGYFAALYWRMTLAVKDGIVNNYFENGTLMEALDVCFAKRYIDAFQAFQSFTPCTHAWQFAFENCKKSNLIVLQHLLLGINTHINLDLAIAAAKVAPGNKIHDLENDFNRINDLIAGLADDIQACLTTIWPPMKQLGKLLNGQEEALLNFSINKARQVSWTNAVLLANMNEQQQQQYIQTMDAGVVNVARGIQQPGFWIQFLLKWIRMTEYQNIDQNIQLIETVKN